MSELPPGWVSARTGDLFQVVGGGTPSRDNPRLWSGDIPWISSADISDRGEITPRRSVSPSAMSASATNLVPAYSVLVVTRVGLGKVALTPYPLCFSQDCHGLLIEPSMICPDFVALQMRHRVLEFKHISRGTTISGVTKRQLEDTLLVIPPLPEQRRIVAEIEKQFTRVDQAAHQLELAARRTERLASTVVRSAFAKPFPTKPLRELAALRGGLTMHADRKDIAHCSPTPYLRVANVQRGFLNLDVVKTIMAMPGEVAELALREGDILLNEGGDRDKLGRGWIWQGEIPMCIHQNHVFRARVHGPVLPKWISYYANEIGQSYFQREGKQTTNLASINITKLGSLPIPIAPLEEQERILRDIESGISGCQKIGTIIHQTQARSARLRQAILAKAFSGQLVPQDPGDEPASMLLERIRAERAGSGEPRAKRAVRKRSAKT